MRSQQLGRGAGWVALGRTPVCLCAALVIFVAAPAGGQISVEIPTTLVGWNAFSDNVQWPEVGVGVDGTIVFGWSENGYQAPTAAVTHAYLSDGLELGPPTRINPSGAASFGSVVSDLRGGFLAAWSWNQNSGDDYIIGRRLDGLGRGVGTQMVVNVDRPTANAALVRTAGVASGFVFMWQQGSAGWMRLYDPNGNSLMPSTVFSSGTTFTHVTNDVVALSDGGFVLAWADLYAGGSWARLYDGSGQARGPKFQLSPEIDIQRMAAFPGGWAVIGTTSNREWSDPPPPHFTANQVIVRRFDNDGTPHGDHILVHDAGYRKWVQADLTFDTRGNLFATWITQDWDWPNDLSPPNARAFDAHGNPHGDAVVLSDKRGYDVHPEALPNGGIVTVWEGLGNVPYEQTVYAVWVRICAADQVCEVPPTSTPTVASPSPTPTMTQPPTPTPIPTPGCGDGTAETGEECDDGNRRNGDGCDSRCRVEECGNQRIEGDEQCDPPDDGKFCRSDCTFAPLHDSVMVAEKPIDVVIPASQSSVTKILPLQVRNADIEPKPERPGHVIRLVASDGDCPAGTIKGLPDFERGVAGDQDSTMVAGGTPATAHVVVFAARESFRDLDQKIPMRCTLVFLAETLVDGNIDPTPENNTITVELNVRTAKGEGGQEQASRSNTEPGFFIGSLRPLKLRVRLGSDQTQRRLAVKVTNGLPLGSSHRQVRLAVEDGSCPPGTVVVSELGRVSGGGEPQLLAPRRSLSGNLLVTVTKDLFTSASTHSPGRCLATLVVSEPTGLDERANQRTTLLVEAVDLNDTP